jgi:hypothetical protein
MRSDHGEAQGSADKSFSLVREVRERFISYPISVWLLLYLAMRLCYRRASGGVNHAWAEGLELPGQVNSGPWVVSSVTR